MGFICGLVGIRLNSHWLPPEVMGAYGLFLSFAPFGLLVVHAGTMRYIERHWAACPDRQALRASVFNTWLRRLPWLGAAAILGGAAIDQLAPGQWLMASAGLLITLPLLPLMGFGQAALQAQQSHWRDLAGVSVSSTSRTLFGPLAFVAGGGVVAGLWLGFALHAMLAAVVAGLLVARFVTPAREGTSAEGIPAVYRGPLFIGLAVSSWVLAGLNRWVVAGFHGEVQAGYFSLLGGAAMILPGMLSNAVIQFVRPGFIRLGDEGHEGRVTLKRRVDLVAAVYLILGLGVAAGLALAGPWLIGPLIDPAYEGGLSWLGPAGCFGVTLGLVAIFSTTLNAAQRESANGPAVLGTGVLLMVAVTTAGAMGLAELRGVLLLSPLVPALFTRTLARKALR